MGLYPKVPIDEAIAIYENRGVKFETKVDEPVTLAHFRDRMDNVLYLCQERSGFLGTYPHMRKARKSESLLVPND